MRTATAPVATNRPATIGTIAAVIAVTGATTAIAPRGEAR